MNSSREQQPNTVEWLRPPQLGHAASTLTPACWVTNPDFPRALLHEQVTGISGWQGEAIPPRVEQYSQLHKEKAKGLFRTLAIPKKTQGKSCFFFQSDVMTLNIYCSFSFGRTSKVSLVAISSGTSCWIRWRPKSQPLPVGPARVGRSSIHL